MAKWADYGIYCASYTPNGERIASLGALDDKGDRLGTRHSFTRQQVVDALGKGVTFVTIVKNEKGEWNKGAQVERYEVNGEWFIKTVPNNTAKDNLGQLPSC